MTDEEKNILLNEQYGNQLKEQTAINEKSTMILCNCAVTITWLADKFLELATKLPYNPQNILADVEGSRIAIETAETEINRINEIGKVEQTLEGNGSIENPFKGWKVGMSVEAGKWYLTENNYLWEAIKTGVPASEVDAEYFDVVGL